MQNALWTIEVLANSHGNSPIIRNVYDVEGFIMMIKLTERCSMGCIHCMNDARPDGIDMELGVLRDVLNFLKAHGLGRTNLVVSGGEPTEHKEFDLFMKEIIAFGKEHKWFTVVTVTTNGEDILKDPERFKGYILAAKEAGFHLLFQVSADTRYYPRRIPVHKRIFREEGFVLCDNCVEQIYPQGRALENNIPWESKGSKCFNVRAIAHQTGKGTTLKDIETVLLNNMKFCTPHIGVDGSIRLGESDLCPVCASIYDSMDEIMEKVRAFKCHGCEHVNAQLPDLYKKLL